MPSAGFAKCDVEPGFVDITGKPVTFLIDPSQNLKAVHIEIHSCLNYFTHTQKMVIIKVRPIKSQNSFVPIEE